MRQMNLKQGSKAVALRQPKLAELVASHFRSRIVRGEIPEGASLPPEAQIMSDLGVSRAVLREAYRILEAEALVQLVGGRSGARVIPASNDSVTYIAGLVLQRNHARVRDLFETRLVIEPYVVRFLAERNDRDIVDFFAPTLSALVRLIETDAVREFTIMATHFQCALVERSGNVALTMIARTLRQLILPYHLEIATAAVPGDPDLREYCNQTITAYHRLLTLIAAGDADGAERHWREHILIISNRSIPGDEGDRLISVVD